MVLDKICVFYVSPVFIFKDGSKTGVRFVNNERIQYTFILGITINL